MLGNIHQILLVAWCVPLQCTVSENQCFDILRVTNLPVCEISVGFDVNNCLLLFGFANLERIELSKLPLLHYVLQFWVLVFKGLEEFQIEPVVGTSCVPQTIHWHTKEIYAYIHHADKFLQCTYRTNLLWAVWHFLVLQFKEKDVLKLWWGLSHACDCLASLNAWSLHLFCTLSSSQKMIILWQRLLCL